LAWPAEVHCYKAHTGVLQAPHGSTRRSAKPGTHYIGRFTWSPGDIPHSEYPPPVTYHGGLKRIQPPYLPATAWRAQINPSPPPTQQQHGGLNGSTPTTTGAQQSYTKERGNTTHTLLVFTGNVTLDRNSHHPSVGVPNLALKHIPVILPQKSLNTSPPTKGLTYPSEGKSLTRLELPLQVQ
ncbi:Hypothetical predicted protein, partial [Pelobates cultripes]